ncbi:MAG TPA: serine hydrolase, partial [Chitinophagaceae bacterium]|nr:serine hydrolase [Chitinophagaceae bacterium]
MKICLMLIGLLPLIAIAQNEKQMKTSIDSVFQHYFKDDEPGAAVLLVKDGKIIYENAFGLADMQTKEKITTNTLFNLGSISKTVV